MCMLSGRCCAIQMTTLFLMFQVVFWASPPSSAGSDFDIPLNELKPAAGKNFEIPLSDLKKGEKKAKRSDTRGRKGKKKTESAEQEDPREATEPGGDSRKPAPSTGGPATEFTPETQVLQRQATPEKRGGAASGVAGTTAPTADGISIVHDPYSYVVAGKCTVIKTVIISAPEGLRAVCCRFRTAETGGFARVPMTKEQGTNYTYTATLPPLSPGAESLRYMLIATDASGKETLSREFSIPVRGTSVVPGWQREQSQGAIKVWLEDPGKPLEGFSEVTVVKTAPS